MVLGPQGVEFDVVAAGVGGHQGFDVGGGLELDGAAAPGLQQGDEAVGFVDVVHRVGAGGGAFLAVALVGQGVAVPAKDGVFGGLGRGFGNPGQVVVGVGWLVAFADAAAEGVVGEACGAGRSGLGSGG